MQAYNVYHQRKLIDTVYYIQSISCDQIKRDLIQFDGYPMMITVKKDTTIMPLVTA